MKVISAQKQPRRSQKLIALKISELILYFDLKICGKKLIECSESFDCKNIEANKLNCVGISANRCEYLVILEGIFSRTEQ